MRFRNVTTSFSCVCKHCGGIWGVGDDHARAMSHLPSPRHAGTFKVPCPTCGKKNPVTVRVDEGGDQ